MAAGGRRQALNGNPDTEDHKRQSAYKAVTNPRRATVAKNNFEKLENNRLFWPDHIKLNFSHTLKKVSRNFRKIESQGE